LTLIADEIVSVGLALFDSLQASVRVDIDS